MFYAIKKNDLNLARFLLDQEIDLFVRYPVEVNYNTLKLHTIYFNYN